MMRTLLLIALSGCSFIYNPSNISSSSDATGSDAEVIADADSTMLELDSVAPTTLIEGQGGGSGTASRQAVVVISGHQMVKDGTSVAITAHAGARYTPQITVDNAQLDVAADGNMIAVPVTIPQDDALLSTDLIRLDVAVTQNTPNGPITKTLSALANDAPVLQVQGLAELRGTDATIASGVQTYSVVHLTGKITATGAAQLRSTTSIEIDGASSFNANAITPGAGGNAGGAGGQGGLLNGSTGAMGTGPGGGNSSGGVAKWVGDDQLTTFGGQNTSSGGGGGDGMSLGAAGKDGGGGGGVIEISAAGDLKVGGISAKGAPGVTAMGANSGGAGTGGVVLLRSGGTADVGTVDVSGGVATNAGRARVDAPGAITIVGTAFQGPTFVTTTPMIERSESPTLTVIGPKQHNISYYINNADGSDSHSGGTILVPQGGTAMIPLTAKLFRGFNTLCVIVENASAGVDTAGQCIQIAYLYTP